MGRSRGRSQSPEWVEQRLAGIGLFTVESSDGEYSYTFPALPDLATAWCQFALEIIVPFDPTPQVVDRLVERWEWYRPRHPTDSEVFRSAVIQTYRACDDFGPRDLPDADVLRQVTRARIEVATLDTRDHELYAEMFAAFADEHSPLLAWDDSEPGWIQIA